MLRSSPTCFNLHKTKQRRLQDHRRQLHWRIHHGGWGELDGYLKRAALPTGMPVADAPAEDPRRPLSREEYVAWLRGKRMDVTENSDGSLTLHGRVRRGQA